jgi:Spy/CpxP family protein refolding chaperone
MAKLVAAAMICASAGVAGGQTVLNAAAPSAPMVQAVPQAAQQSAAPPVAQPSIPQQAAPSVPQQVAPARPPVQQPPLERAFGGPKMQGRWWKSPRAVEGLQLTAEQQKAMDGILMEYREKLIDLHAGLQKAELKFEEQIDNESPSENAILTQIDKVAQARAELEKANARYLLAIWNKLTLEQRNRMKEIRLHGWQHSNRGMVGQRRQMDRPEANSAIPGSAR